MAELTQSGDSHLAAKPSIPKPTSVPGPKAEVKQFTTRELIREALEERKEIIGAVRSSFNHALNTIQDLINQDERVMAIYHKELYPEEHAEAEKKYKAALEEAAKRQVDGSETPK